MKSKGKIAGIMLALLVTGSFTLLAQRGMRGAMDSVRMSRPGRGSDLRSDEDRQRGADLIRMRGMRHFYGFYNVNPWRRGMWDMPFYGMRRGMPPMPFGRNIDSLMVDRIRREWNRPDRPYFEREWIERPYNERIPGLTDKQKEDISDLRFKQQQEMQKFREEITEKMRTLRESHRKKMMDILDEEQKKWFESDIKNP